MYKKTCPVLPDRFFSFFFGALGGTRTHTALRPQGPQPCVSTNSTTSACENGLYTFPSSLASAYMVLLHFFT